MKQGADLKHVWEDFIANCNERAYYELYTHYYHYLSFIGFKKGGKEVKVKDCINDLFLYLWENREKLGGVNDHHNYIITAFLRKLFRKESFSDSYSIETFDLPDYMAIPSAEALHIVQDSRNEISRVLKAFVARLPSKQSKMIYQKFYLGLSYREIADANGVSINTVYNTVYKAMDKLKLLMADEQLNIVSMLVAALSIFFLFFFQNK